MVAYICTLLLLCFFQRVSGDIEEPKCFSRFDYDEKMLMKLLRFEDKLQKFEEFIKESKANQEQEKAERENKFISEIDEFKTQVIEEVVRQRNQSEEIVGFLDEAKAKLNASLVEHKQSHKEKIVAFTVTNPSGGSTSTPITFTTVITNEGDGFNTSTGKFMCTVSGLYYFTLNIIKKRDSSDVDTAGCHIGLNGNNKVRAYIDPQDGATGADNGSYGVSNSVYLRLNIGDVVTLRSCNSDGAARMESWSSFSGYLVKADV